MIERHYGPLTPPAASFSPCVTVLRAAAVREDRAFIRAALPAWTYLDLERPSDNVPLAADPEARLSQLAVGLSSTKLNVFPNFPSFARRQ